MSEHRLEVLLLWDMVASTRLLLDLQPERYNTVANPLKDTLVTVAKQFGGESFKDTGDGGWVAFSSAQDAIAGAVEMQRQAHRATAAYGRSEAVAIRVVLAVGDVWVGPTGDRTGLAINTAARLDELVDPEEILCTGTVTALATGWGGHESELVGFEKLRDVPGQTEVRRIVWQHSPTADRLGIPGILAVGGPYRFVGRTAELGELVHLWRSTRGGRGRAVTLLGTAGVGKSRLAGELAQIVRSDGGAVLYGQCDEYAGYTYEPFVQALETYADAVPNLGRDLGRDAIELSRIVPSIRDRLPELSPAPPVEPNLGRRRLFEAVKGWLAGLSAEAPTLLVLDDFTWADDGTANMARHLLAGLREQPILVLITARPEELTSAAQATLSSLDNTTTVNLSGLDQNEVLEFAADVVGDELDVTAQAIARRVGEDAGGNPFMVGELLKGMLEAAPTGPTQLSTRLLSSGLGSEYVPDAVRTIVRRRIERLSGDAQRLVRLAAAAGERFDPKVVQYVMGAIPNYAATVAEAERAGILEHSAESARFTHSIVRYAVLADELLLERTLEHRRIGEAIEQVYAGNLERHYDALAYQYSQCDTPDERDRAIHFAGLAAEAAIDRLAHDQAVRHYRLALRLSLKRQRWPAPTDDWADLEPLLVLQSWPADAGSSGEDDVDASWTAAIDLLASDADSREALLAGMAVNETLLARFFDVASEVPAVLDDFFGLLDSVPTPVQLEICQAMIDLGRSLKWAGHSAFRRVLRVAARTALRLETTSHAVEAANLCADALIVDSRGIFTWVGVTDTERVELLERAERLPTTPDRAALLAASHGAELPFSDEADRPMELSSHALQLARSLGDSERARVVRARVMNLHINCLWRPDKVDERLTIARELLEICRDLNRPSLTLQAATSYLQAAMERGEFDRAPELLSLIEGTARELQQPLTVGYAKLRLANWEATQGRLDESNHLANEAAKLALEAGQPDAETFLAGQQFIIYLHRAQLADIAPVMEMMTKQADSIAPFRSGLATAWADAGDAVKARVAFDTVMDRLDRATFDFNWLLAVALAGYPCWYLEDAPAARTLLRLLDPYQEQYVDIASGFYGAVNHYRALLLDCVGDHDEADVKFAWAAEAHRNIPSPPWHARTLHDWGLALRRRGSETASASTLGQAASVADAAGLAGLAVWIDRARRVPANLGEGGGRVGADSGGRRQC